MIGTLRREVFDRLLIVNEHHLRRVLAEYLLHYNTARPHRFLGQLTPAQADSQPPEPISLADHRIRQKQVLGGLIREYYIAALPPRVATENAGHHPNHIFEPHTLEWPLAEARRKHVKDQISAAGLPVRHETWRFGSPHTLVLTKTGELFRREAKARKDATASLQWLAAQWRR
jgi:hypothetical protein